ncbi:MAG: sensor histidine kinase [Phycisphaerae bacterium]
MSRLVIDRLLLGFAILLSLALTTLTVTAVMRQGETLRERELANLRTSAAREAGLRTAALHADLERAFLDATTACESGGVVALDDWLTRQSLWFMAFLEEDEREWRPLPLPALYTVTPRSDSELLREAEQLEFVEQSYREATEAYARLADSGEAQLRVESRLAQAALLRKSGALRAAADAYIDAAGHFSREPLTRRLAYAARLAAIDSLHAGGDNDAARKAAVALLEQMIAEHPARYSGPDVALLRALTDTLGLPDAPGADTPPAGSSPAVDGGTSPRDWLEEIEHRARRRDATASVAADLDRTFAARRESIAEQFAFFTAQIAPQYSVIVATRAIGLGRYLAVVAPARDLVERYWGPYGPSAEWRVVLPGERSAEEPIRRLGDAFGGAELIPTPATIAKLWSANFRRITLLFTTALGTAGAWGVVIWTMFRVMQRQRELVRLQRRFVADVSHELKTPLALIRLLSETLQTGRIREIERVNQYLATITRESERLTGLLDSILDFSKMDSGRKQYQFAQCEPGAVARQAWALFEPQFARDGFTTKLEIAPSLPTLMADAPALQQLLVNLLQNAYRYSHDQKFVRLAVDANERFVFMIVEDRGIGMTRGHLDRIGDSFYRAPDPHVRKTRGTGLGLTIVKHIVDAHRGSLDVQSRPGKGSTFTVRLPREPAPA